MSVKKISAGNHRYCWKRKCIWERDDDALRRFISWRSLAPGCCRQITRCRQFEVMPRTPVQRGLITHSLAKYAWFMSIHTAEAGSYNYTLIVNGKIQQICVRRFLVKWRQVLVRATSLNIPNSKEIKCPFLWGTLWVVRSLLDCRHAYFHSSSLQVWRPRRGLGETTESNLERILPSIANRQPDRPVKQILRRVERRGCCRQRNRC